jgi:hypothetical protein
VTGIPSRAAYALGMRNDSAYGRYRNWARSLQGRMLAAVAVVVVLAGTGAPIGTALGLGAVVAVGGLVMYAISSRGAH